MAKEIKEKGWPNLNKCEECGYLHGCHKSDCSKVNSIKKEK